MKASSSFRHSLLKLCESLSTYLYRDIFSFLKKLNGNGKFQINYLEDKYFATK